MVQRFYEISLNLTQYHYGPDSRQFLEFIQPSYKHKKEVGDLDTKLPVVLFVHGGAWGSGRPWMYRLVAQGIADLGFRVALLGYRVYPEADTLSQVSDLALALEWMAINKSLIGLQETNVYISGHSSGAHITAMYLLQCALEGIECPIFISGFIGLSGVYCIYKHYLYEKARGVHEISPMKAANGLMPKFEEHSPSSLARKLTHKQAKMLPPMFLLHGTADETVPFTSTLEFSEVLGAVGVACAFKWLQNGDHFKPIEELMFGNRMSGTQESLLFFYENVNNFKLKHPINSCSLQNALRSHL